MWNIPLHCVNVCHCDWFNKEADWPITGQDKVKGRIKQNAGKKDRVRGVVSICREKQNGHTILKKGTKPCVKAWIKVWVI